MICLYMTAVISPFIKLKLLVLIFILNWKRFIFRLYLNISIFFRKLSWLLVLYRYLTYWVSVFICLKITLLRFNIFRLPWFFTFLLTIHYTLRFFFIRRLLLRNINILQFWIYLADFILIIIILILIDILTFILAFFFFILLCFFYFFNDIILILFFLLIFFFFVFFWFIIILLFLIIVFFFLFILIIFIDFILLIFIFFFFI